MVCITAGSSLYPSLGLKSNLPVDGMKKKILEYEHSNVNDL